MQNDHKSNSKHEIRNPKQIPMTKCPNAKTKDQLQLSLFEALSFLVI